MANPLSPDPAPARVSGEICEPPHDFHSKDLRLELIATARRMAACGLNRGTSGNLSVRHGEGFYITPTGMPYDTLEIEDLPWMPFGGQSEAHGRRKPSSEWRLHHDLYTTRPEAGAVLHAHSTFAISLACLRTGIPPFHYMIALFGGDTVRCAEYATFGTQELADAAQKAMQDRSACLLANHGLLVFGENLKQALDHAIELEALCEQYWRACQLGQPILLTEREMAVVLEQFSQYGQQDDAADRRN
ncbi:MAG: L-fuculose phosphate aldolase [Betaproteobacteria bacterium ADurb.Bin341]|nr:MAG: L-fuculose phosphate aldolase [Betaproteobacteria bacterium ADurb.Bin341]